MMKILHITNSVDKKVSEVLHGLFLKPVLN
jgi:hypothetical protein